MVPLPPNVYRSWSRNRHVSVTVTARGALYRPLLHHALQYRSSAPAVAIVNKSHLLLVTVLATACAAHGLMFLPIVHFPPDTSPEREFILRDKPHYIVMLNGVEGMGSWHGAFDVVLNHSPPLTSPSTVAVIPPPRRAARQ